MKKNVSDISQLVDAVILDIPGFTSRDELLSLFNITYGLRYIVGDVIEVGSWCGRASVILAEANDTRTYCIDIFPDLKDWKYNEENDTWSIGSVAYTVEHPIWNKTFMSRLFPTYMNNESLFDLFNEYTSKFTDRIISHKGDVISFFASYPNIKIKVAFIDSNHDYRGVLQDIKAIIPKMVSNGIICIDDYTPDFYGVQNAVNDTILNNETFVDGIIVTRKLFMVRKK